MNPPRWSGKKTAIAAALAIGVGTAGAIGAAATLPQSASASQGGPGGMAPRQWGGGPMMQNPNSQNSNGQNGTGVNGTGTNGIGQGSATNQVPVNGGFNPQNPAPNGN